MIRKVKLILLLSLFTWHDTLGCKSISGCLECVTTGGCAFYITESSSFCSGGKVGRGDYSWKIRSTANCKSADGGVDTLPSPLRESVPTLLASTAREKSPIVTPRQVTLFQSTTVGTTSTMHDSKPIGNQSDTTSGTLLEKGDGVTNKVDGIIYQKPGETSISSKPTMRHSNGRIKKTDIQNGSDSPKRLAGLKYKLAELHCTQFFVMKELRMHFRKRIMTTNREAFMKRCMKMFE